jgi:hypothetical protein
MNYSIIDKNFIPWDKIKEYRERMGKDRFIPLIKTSSIPYKVIINGLSGFHKPVTRLKILKK